MFALESAWLVVFFCRGRWRQTKGGTLKSLKMRESGFSVCGQHNTDEGSAVTTQHVVTEWAAIKQ